MPQPPPRLDYMTPRSGKTVTVAFCAHSGEAELVCGELRDAGVPAVAVNHHAVALGPYSGGSQVEVQVPVEDMDRAAQVLARLPDRNDVVPEPEHADGSADFATGEQGARVALAVVAEFATAQEMHDASAALGSARVRTFLPNLVPRPADAAGAPPPVFRVRVTVEDLSRARAVLEEDGDPDEPRCPQCASWRVHRQGGSFFGWLREIFVGGGSADGVKNFQCLRCNLRFAWGNPRGTFEVVVPRTHGATEGDSPKPPPATAP
jgi:hypothetical protein